MKYCRFLLNGHARYGRVEEINGQLMICAPAPIPEEDLRAQLAPVGDEAPFAPLPLDEAQLLTPVTPTKIVCVARNYSDHAREMGNPIPTEPMIFLKPPSSLLAPGGAVRLPSFAERVDFEGELALVIGKKLCRLAADEDWKPYVRGYTLANDVSCRDLQKKDGQWTRAKGSDTFCPMGPLVSNELDPAPGLALATYVNGELRQNGNTNNLIFSFAELLRFISASLTLEVGDVILTGTPAGVGPLTAGDAVAVHVAGLGTLRHTVVSD